MEIRIYELTPPPEMIKAFETVRELAFLTDDEFEAKVGTRPLNEEHRDRLILAYVQEHHADALAVVDAMVEATIEQPTKH